jgi:hypothetical protein
LYQAGLPTCLCNRPPERIRLHVVREAAPAVDLDHGQPFPVFGLEDGVAGDVDLAQVEAELLAELGDHATGLLAEMAALGVVDDDVGYG